MLSVDPGHRFAAACAVWETLSGAQVEDLCRTAGRVPPRPDELLQIIPLDRLEKDVGFHQEAPRKGRELRVDELRAEAVRIARLGLARRSFDDADQPALPG